MAIVCHVRFEGKEADAEECGFVIAPRVGEVVRVPGHALPYDVTKISHQAAPTPEDEAFLFVTLSPRKSDDADRT